MAKLVLTPAARSDLIEIDEWGYQQFGASVADQYSRQLSAAFDQLAEYPLSGSAAPKYGKAYRCLVHRRHRIFYIVDQNEVLIVRILHHAMDPRRALQEAGR